MSDKNVLFAYNIGAMKDKEGNYYIHLSINENVLSRYYKYGNLTIFVFITGVFSKSSPKMKNYYKVNPKIRVVELINMKKLKNVISLRKRIYNNKIIKCEVLNSQYIFVREPSSVGRQTAKISRSNNKKYVTEIVTDIFKALWYHSFKGKIFSIPAYLLMKFSVKRSNSNIYISKYLQKRYPSGNNEIVISDVVISPDYEKNFKIRLNKVGKKNSQNLKLKILTVGGLNVKYKNQSKVIKSIYRLRKKGINRFKYYLIGGGNDIKLRKLIGKLKLENEVFILGPQPNQIVLEKMKNTDIYIQPSSTEGLGRAIIEAMSTGSLCIGTNVGGIPELIDKPFLYSLKREKDLDLILASITKKDLFEAAERSIYSSKKYSSYILEEKRTVFINSYFLLNDSKIKSKEN